MDNWKDSCKVATPGVNINLTGGAPSTLDGCDFAVGDRILVKDQTAPPGLFSPDNGIYCVQTVGTGSNGTWVRSSDANTSALVQCGLTTYIEQGTSAKLSYQLTSPGILILGETGLRFEIMLANIYPFIMGLSNNYRFFNGVFQVIDVNGMFRTVFFDANGVLNAGPPET